MDVVVEPCANSANRDKVHNLTSLSRVPMCHASDLLSERQWLVLLLYASREQVNLCGPIMNQIGGNCVTWLSVLEIAKQHESSC